MTASQILKKDDKDFEDYKKDWTDKEFVLGDIKQFGDIVWFYDDCIPKLMKLFDTESEEEVNDIFYRIIEEGLLTSDDLKLTTKENDKVFQIDIELTGIERAYKNL